MNAKDEEGIDREAWRRRLGNAGEPAPITDLRIRTEARRAVTPRIGHWWLPASLAASLVLAVFVVQWQIADDDRAPVVRESDMMMQELPVQAPVYEVAPPPMDSIPPPMPDMPAMEAEAPRRREKTGEAELDGKLDEYAVAPPPHEERAVTSAAEAAVDAAAPVAPPAPAAAIKASPAGDELQNITITGARTRQARSDEELRTPEEWYAAIEALRKAGKDAEADAELERLEEAHPGWLARRQSGNP